MISREQIAEYIRVNLTTDELLGLMDKVSAKPLVSVPAARAPKPPSNGNGGGPELTTKPVDGFSDLVLKQFEPGRGYAASEIAEALGAPQSRAAACIKKLKFEGKIFQGGERKFARYGISQQDADAASLAARGS